MVTVEQGKIRSFFEGLVVLAIILVLIQTFLEDAALIGGWSWDVRKVLLISGFGFDLFFTFEFLVRFFSAALRRETGEYLLHQRGLDRLARLCAAVVVSQRASYGGGFSGRRNLQRPGRGV